MKQNNAPFAFYFLLIILFTFHVDVMAQPNDSWKAGSAYQLHGQSNTVYCFIEIADNP